MSDETKGGLTVDLDADDLQHLIKHGRSQVTKEIGPLEVNIRCDPKIVHRLDMIDPSGETSTVAEIEAGASDGGNRE